MRLLLFAVTWVYATSLRMSSRAKYSLATKESYCMGSGQGCSGNECCPGYEKTWGKTFPCPEMDPAEYDLCESPSRLDLYEASVLNFADVEFKNLEATTGDVGILMKEASTYLGVPRDLHVYAVDDAGEQIPITNETTDSFGPAFGGSVLKFNFLGGTRTNLRFSWGTMEDGVWTPNPLPWVLVTFMDLDAGSTRRANEKITTSDASRYTNGADITVDESNGTITFACYVSGNVQNPTSGILSDEQERVAASLEFEEKEYFTMTIENNAGHKRAVFFTGITTLNWPEQAPAPTPSPTVSANGDPHVQNMIGDTFDLWKTGWSTFVQIPQNEDGSVKLLVRGDVRRYGRDPCAPSFLQQVRINGTWLGDHEIIVRAGSLESSDPFSVTLDGSEPLYLNTNSETVFIDESDLRLRGDIAVASEEWGPDARIRMNVGSTVLSIVQHTEGRGETSNSMLDLSVAGLGDIVESVGGWLGVEGAHLAGEAPIECREDMTEVDKKR